MQMRIVLNALLLCAFMLPQFASATPSIRCSDGSISHPASELEAQNGGVPLGYPVCPVDAQAGVTEDAGSAKQYLQSLGNGSGTTRPDSFQNLNSAFAICAAQFLKEYQSRYGPVRITSAWRSQGDQARVCPVAVSGKCGGSNSNHTKGLALDVRPNDENFQQMWSFAKQNPQFGVCFPFEGGDRVHMILQGIPGSGEAQRCVSNGYGNQPCSGSGFDPSQIRNATASGGTPTSGFSNMLRDYLSGGQQQAGGMGGYTGAMPANNSMPSTIAGPSGSTAGMGMPSGMADTSGGPTGTGNTAIPTTIGTPSTSLGATIATPAPISDQLGTMPLTSGTGSADLLFALAYGTATSTTIATGAPITLNDDLSDAVGAGGTDTSGHVLMGAGDPRYVLQPSLQTFTSPDLRYAGPGAGYAPPANTTMMQRALESLRQALLSLLERLRPFGGALPEHSHEEEYLE